MTNSQQQNHLEPFPPTWADTSLSTAEQAQGQDEKMEMCELPTYLFSEVHIYRDEFGIIYTEMKSAI